MYQKAMRERRQFYDISRKVVSASDKKWFVTGRTGTEIECVQTVYFKVGERKQYTFYG